MEAVAAVMVGAAAMVAAKAATRADAAWATVAAARAQEQQAKVVAAVTAPERVAVSPGEICGLDTDACCALEGVRRSGAP